MVALPLHLPTAAWGGHMGHFLLSMLILSGSTPLGNDTDWDPNPRTRAHPNGLAQRCATVLTCANQVDSNDKVSAAPVDVVLADARHT